MEDFYNLKGLHNRLIFNAVLILLKALNSSNGLIPQLWAQFVFVTLNLVLQLKKKTIQ